jgi:hypothetical protein
MELELILSVLDKQLRKNFGVDKTNEILVGFMTDLIMCGRLNRMSANQYLTPYGCSVSETCWGCQEDQPNQLAHTDPGGCLYFNTFGPD